MTNKRWEMESLYSSFFFLTRWAAVRSRWILSNICDIPSIFPYPHGSQGERMRASRKEEKKGAKQGEKPTN